MKALKNLAHCVARKKRGQTGKGREERRKHVLDMKLWLSEVGFGDLFLEGTNPRRVAETFVVYKEGKA